MFISLFSIRWWFLRRIWSFLKHFTCACCYPLQGQHGLFFGVNSFAVFYPVSLGFDVHYSCISWRGLCPVEQCQWFTTSSKIIWTTRHYHLMVCRYHLATSNKPFGHKTKLKAVNTTWKSRMHSPKKVKNNSTLNMALNLLTFRRLLMPFLSTFPLTLCSEKCAISTCGVIILNIFLL